MCSVSIAPRFTTVPAAQRPGAQPTNAFDASVHSATTLNAATRRQLSIEWTSIISDTQMTPPLRQKVKRN